MPSFYAIIVVQNFEVIINFLDKYFRIYFAVGSNIPVMRKKSFVRNTTSSILADFYIKFFCSKDNSHIHIVYTHVFAAHTQEMFCSSCDLDFTFFYVCKSECVTNKVSPGP